MNKIIIEGNYAILPGAKAIVSETKVIADAAKPISSPAYDLSPSEWSRWGDSNLFPQEVLLDINKNSVALRALDKRKRVHFGRGIVAYRESPATDGTSTPVRTPVTDPEILEFMRLNQVNLIWPDLIMGLETFANGWIEFIMNKGRNRINRVFVKDPAYCRLGKMDASNKIPSVYYSAQWEMSPSFDRVKVAMLPMYDAAKNTGTIYPDPQFAMHVYYRSFNKSFYHLPLWNAVRLNKWMYIANSVPTLKAAIMKNQMIIKYHITIPDDYFTKRYPSPDYTKEQCEAKRLEVLADMDAFLADVENSGKAFISWSFLNKVKQDYLTGWKIEVIQNKLDNTAYLPDSQAANSEILFAIGVDPCLIGAGNPGEAIGAGSGSDKREAYWMLNSDMGTDRAVSLAPLYFIRDFNKWDPTIQFDYVTVDTSQTQDQHPTKTTKRIDQNQP
ncbi:MAG: hypothetical protein NT040_11220 [Bacteroidetes bacterium]|nr:hypothetical protein [Bacteroidota bacterium]